MFDVFASLLKHYNMQYEYIKTQNNLLYDNYMMWHELIWVALS